MLSNCRKLLCTLAITACTATVGYGAEQPEVVVSIPPIQSLVSGIMEGIGEPLLLVPGGATPHSYSLRPSQARILNKARIIIRVSDQMEAFLERSIENLSNNAEVITLSDVEGMTLYEPREGGVWEMHGHDEGQHQGSEKYIKHAHGEKHEGHVHDHHGHKEVDPHLWLDPQNAKRIVSAVSVTLQKAYPGQAKAISANTEKLTRKLEKLDRDLLAATRPLRGKPYIVFHDAFRYFDERYKLSPAGAITISPDRPTGARRLLKIRTRIKAQGVSCVFSEPQFQPKLVQTLIAGTDAQAGTLDPIGADLKAGPGLYFKLMRNLATNLAACLKNPS
jgi:zinc transport system substrate-binding protein